MILKNQNYIFENTPTKYPHFPMKYQSLNLVCTLMNDERQLKNFDTTTRILSEKNEKKVKQENDKETSTNFHFIFTKNLRTSI
jgi:hypothetical protein